MAQGFASQPTPEEVNINSSDIPTLSTIKTHLTDCFSGVEDPRVNRTKKHLLKDILVIAILAVIAGANGWEDMENYGLSKQLWLQQFLQLPHGIPSDDTFRRLFERINPQVLEKCLSQWLNNLLGCVSPQIVPIDGKTLRGSYDRNHGIQALHLVTAWASEQKLVLAQVKVEDKSNEITAIPLLLELFDVKGTIITIDAMGTQKEIMEQIISKKANYVVCLKANHPTLFNQVKQWFNQHKEDNFSDSDIEISYHQQTQKAHHRIETRKVWAIPVTAFGGLYQQEEWIGLTTIVIVERTRRLWNKNTHQVQFYLSSLPADAQKNGSAIRKHWAIENQMHWTLDVTFSEDKCRVRSGHSPQNLALLRRWALNALNQEKTINRSLRQKSKRAAMNNEYMLTVLKSFCLARLR